MMSVQQQYRTHVVVFGRTGSGWVSLICSHETVLPAVMMIETTRAAAHVRKSKTRSTITSGEVLLEGTVEIKRAQVRQLHAHACMQRHANSRSNLPHPLQVRQAAETRPQAHQEGCYCYEDKYPNHSGAEWSIWELDVRVVVACEQNARSTRTGVIQPGCDRVLFGSEEADGQHGSHQDEDVSAHQQAEHPCCGITPSFISAASKFRKITALFARRRESQLFVLPSASLLGVFLMLSSSAACVNNCVQEQVSSEVSNDMCHVFRRCIHIQLALVSRQNRNNPKRY